MRLVDAATEADGVSPLSEHVRLHLRYGGDPRARNVLLTTAGRSPVTRTWIRPTRSRGRAASWSSIRRIAAGGRAGRS